MFCSPFTQLPMHHCFFSYFWKPSLTPPWCQLSPQSGAGAVCLQMINDDYQVHLLYFCVAPPQLSLHCWYCELLSQWRDFSIVNPNLYDAKHSTFAFWISRRKFKLNVEYHLQLETFKLIGFWIYFGNLINQTGLILTNISIALISSNGVRIGWKLGNLLNNTCGLRLVVLELIFYALTDGSHPTQVEQR